MPGDSSATVLTTKPVYPVNLGELNLINRLITADWNKPSNDRWTVPLGGGAGRLVKFGKQPVDFKVQAFANVVHPDAGPDWTVMAAVKFLFPK